MTEAQEDKINHRKTFLISGPVTSDSILLTEEEEEHPWALSWELIKMGKTNRSLLAGIIHTYPGGTQG